jgi:hypothetical protein
MGRASAAAVLVPLLFAACHDASKDHPAPAVSLAKVTLTAPPGGSVNVKPEHVGKTVCRAIEARGALKQEDAGVKPGAVLGTDFVELPEGAHVAIKNGTTTRETIFDGPGAVRPCVGGEEEMWMPGGVFTSVVGAGETPGSEVWIVTPHVVVRYGSGAQLHVLGTPSHVDVKLTAGTAWAFPIGAMALHDAGTPRTADGWVEIPGNGSLTFTSRRAPSQVLGECEEAARAAHGLAVAIGTRDASLSQAAPKHVVARRRAHALCSAAELVASRSLDPVERERLLPRARAADAKWRDNSPSP